jgi:hypothetical protein
MQEEISPRGIFKMLQPMMKIMIRKLIRADLAKAKRVLGTPVSRSFER